MTFRKGTSVDGEARNGKKGFIPVYLWILSYLNPYALPISLMILSGIVIAVCEFIFPKFIGYFIDVILPTKDLQAFLYLIPWILVTLLILFVFMMIQNLLQRSVQENAAKDLQYSLLRHLRYLGVSYLEKTSTGKVLTLFNTEVSLVQQLYRNNFPALIQQLIITGVLLGMLLMISLKLTALLSVFYAFYMLVAPYVDKKNEKYSKKAGTLRIELNDAIYNNIASVAEMRANGAIKWRLQALSDAYQHYVKNRLMSQLFSQIRPIIAGTSIYLGTLLIIVYASYLVKGNELSLGEFVQFIFYYFTVMVTITFCVGNLAEQKSIVYQAIPLYSFFKETAAVSEIANPVLLDDIRGEITFDNVHWSYDGTNPVLNGINLTIKPGEKVAIVGTTGGGKSTMLKLIGRFYDPTSGVIKLDGVPLTELSLHQLRDSIGFVFQEPYLFGGTIMENIQFGNPQATYEQIVEAAQKAFAHTFIMQFPDNYKTTVGERGVALSGGQKQRIVLARMFVKQPRIILLDEATSALDNISEQEVKASLDTWFQGHTVVAVAHRLSTIVHYDRIVVIDQGEIIEEGDYNRLIEQRGVFYRLSHSYMKETVV